MLLAGLSLTVLGLVLRGTPATPARVACLVAGLALAGSAVSRRLRTAGWALEERIESAALLAAAALAGLVAYAGCDEEWDSIRLLLGVLAAVALFGSLLVLLPRTPRRVVASLLLLFHFGGIATAVTAVTPRDQPAPWLSMQLWTRVYRPYLTFMYLTNAYHFYSPDPGPPSLLWFRLHYDDGSRDGVEKWVKLPVRSESPIGLAYQRMLALAESTNLPTGQVPLTAEQKDWYEKQTGQKYTHDTWNEVYQRRELGATQFKPPLDVPTDILPNMQYSEPQDHAKRLLASYARHVLDSTPLPGSPDVKARWVRVYRITHRIITPGEVVHGGSPLSEIYYVGYYMGKFNPEGELQDAQDPFLYWYLPIAYVPPNYGERGVPLQANRQPQPGDRLLNGLKMHANATDDPD
jgi:hypothetical protein